MSKTGACQIQVLFQYFDPTWIAILKTTSKHNLKKEIFHSHFDLTVKALSYLQKIVSCYIQWNPIIKPNSKNIFYTQLKKKEEK